MTRVYLDNNSTTIIHPAVAEVMSECHARGFANPASQHEEGRIARKRLEEARQQIGSMLGARMDQSGGDRVLFTSGGTESNNLALRGLVGLPRNQLDGEDQENQLRPNIVISGIEHPSIDETATQLGRMGFEIRRLPVDPLGRIRGEAVDDMIDDRTACLSTMLANHETGVIQPVHEILQRIPERRFPVHTDAVQVAGKTSLSFTQLGVDAMSVSAHKFHGPRGVGVLILRGQVNVFPVLTGGSQQMGIRPGTESVALAVGMGKALEIWSATARDSEQRMMNLRNELENALRREIPTVVIHGEQTARMPHTTNFAIPGMDRQAFLLALDRAGVACSTGSACTSGSSEPSPVLMAMGCPPEVIDGSIRLSLSVHSSPPEIDFAVSRIVEIYRHLATFSGLKNNPRPTR